MLRGKQVNKMKRFLSRLKCNTGGFGWGETGAKAEMTMPGNTPEEAEKLVKKHIPGGWTYELVGETKEDFYLKHL